MEMYSKKCSRVLEVAVAELPELIGDGGVTTRKTSSDMVEKRSREEGDGELDFASNSEFVEFRSSSRRRLMLGNGLASCCSNGASVQLVVDRSTISDSTVIFDNNSGVLSSNGQTESALQLETLTFPGGRYRGEATPSTESCADKSGEMESTVVAMPLMEANSIHKSAVNKMPSEVEIDDFLSAAEKNLQKRFSDKYNFDVVKGVPLKGRYEWVPVKP